MLKRLRMKFVCINMVIVLGMLLVIFGTVIHFTRSSLEQQSIQTLQEIANAPPMLTRPRDPEDQVRLPYFTLQVGVLGDVLAFGSSYHDLTDQQFLQELVQIASASEEQFGVVSQYQLRYCRAVRHMGTAYVFVDISGEISALESLVRSCSLIGAAALIAFWLISLLLARWAVKPVEQAWTQQRQFVADASHELKTPLTVILTNAELLQEAEEPENRQRFVSSILTMSHQMRGLVESLLELARIDNGAVRAMFSRLELSALAEETVLPFEALFFEKDLMLNAGIEPDLWVNGSQSHLRQVMEILLDNAQKYAQPGTVVGLYLVRSGRSCTLSVATRGTPLSGEELKDIFKRFYRADRARAMNHSYGLGLSIADSIVRDHGGRIWAQSEGGVNTFFVQLPLSS